MTSVSMVILASSGSNTKQNDSNNNNTNTSSIIPKFGGAQRRRRRHAGSTVSTSVGVGSIDGNVVDGAQLSSSSSVVVPLFPSEERVNALSDRTSITTSNTTARIVSAPPFYPSSDIDDDNDGVEECPTNDTEEYYDEGEEELDPEEGVVPLVDTNLVYPRRRLLPAAAAGGGNHRHSPKRASNSSSSSGHNRRKPGATDAALPVPSTSLKRPSLGGRNSSNSKMKRKSRKQPRSGGGTTTSFTTSTVLEFIFKFIRTTTISTGRKRGPIIITSSISMAILLLLVLHHDNRIKPTVLQLINTSTTATTTTSSRVLEHRTTNSDIQDLPIEPTSGKPYRSLTYQDIPFQFYSNTSTSCDHAIDPEDISFTLVTQVSEDRLWMITQHCQRWAPGPISAAVYTNKTLPQLWTIFHEQETTYGKCQPNQLTLSIISPPTTSSLSHHQSQDYPVNTLRNLALSKVQTSHIMYADSDFFVSANLYQVLHGQFLKQQLANDPKLALVVPAFQIGQICRHVPTLPEGVDPLTQPECRDDNLPRMPNNMATLTQMLLKHRASAFDPTNRGGHGSTSYKEWFQMSEGDLWDLPCILSNRYEPYVATRFCKEYPPYQPTFTGYGKNKMTQVMHMRHVGYVFSQVGGVFVVHYPHPYAPSRETWNSGIDLRRIWLYNHTAWNQMLGVVSDNTTDAISIDWTRFKRGQVDKIFYEFKKWLLAKVPQSERTPMCPDAFNDDVKLWLNKEDAPPNQREMLLHPKKEPVA